MSLKKGQVINRPAGDPRINFFKNVEITSTCWNWLGSKTKKGYGLFSMATGKYQHHTFLAHRLSLEFNGEKLSENLTVDHLCKNTSCVNPQHLEQVSLKENLLRGNSLSAINARKEFCKRGHSLIGCRIKIANGGIQRICRVCSSDADRKRRKEKQVSGRA